MKLIVDTNILLSALIKDSTTRKIIVKSGWDFFYPEISMHEIRKYKDLVLKKSGMNETSYLKLLNYLLGHITLVPDEKILGKLNEAKKIMLRIDPDDVVFVAAALGLKDSVIWSDDSDFEKQNKVKFLKSQHIVKLFESL
jgi:predicted nucleic acid-binding protein